MKPQCKTTPECLEQLARVMREFGFTSAFEAIGSGFVKYKFVLDPRLMPTFSEPELWSFAIAKLEDKPVFLGDSAYYKGKKVKITGRNEYVDCMLLIESKNGSDGYAHKGELSWTPPKQTVTLKVGDNDLVEVEKAFMRYIIDQDCNYITAYHHDTKEAAEQFRKAMKPLVKEKS